MAVFAVIASMDAAKIGAAIAAQYGANHHQFSPSCWFVPDSGSTKDVSVKLGLTGGVSGAQGVVIKVGAYSGWTGAATWTFLGQHPDAVPNG
jgi:hypothetical protein